MPSVLFDGIAFTNDTQSGIQRYYYEMLRRACEQVDVAVFLDEPQRAAIPQRCRTIARPERFWSSRARMHVWAWRRMRRRFFPTRLPRASVFHTSYFTRSPVPHLPEVTTVHDMVFERLPYHYGPHSAGDALQKAESIRAASRIITVSKTTAAELVAFYPEVRERVVTIYHGAEHLPEPQPANAGSRTGAPYCLYVGYRFAYKNFSTLLEAMACPEWDRELVLRVVGAPFLASERMLIERLALTQRVRHLGRLDDAQLAQEYAGCAAFVFPSLAEGFGLPVLEAQSCGAPLACSDIPVFHEIAGAAAEFFDPLDPESLAAAVKRCVGTRGGERLVAAQQKNVARFSWDRCAAETIAVWNSVAADG